MKNAVITLNYNYKTNLYYDFLRRKVIPTIESYAYRIGADFICMDNKAEKYYKTWNQLQFIEYFDTYDKICYIDGDVIIKENFSEDIFSLVNDENSVGALLFDNNLKCCYDLFVVLVSSRKIWDNFSLPSLSNQTRLWSDSDKINNKPQFAADYCDKYDKCCLIAEECYINYYLNSINCNHIRLNEYIDKYMYHIYSGPYLSEDDYILSTSKGLMHRLYRAKCFYGLDIDVKTLKMLNEYIFKNGKKSL